MRLRKLELKDTALMLEWMHDKSVTANMQADFAEKTIEDCENFIRRSWIETDDLHYAIADDEDIYMGTVSLKHITEKDAEFAIIVRSEAMGTGLSGEAMRKMIRVGLEELRLQYIYWCVLPENARAVKFYDKNGYERVSPDKLELRGWYIHPETYLWYWKKRDERNGC